MRARTHVLMILHVLLIEAAASRAAVICTLCGVRVIGLQSSLTSPFGDCTF